MPKSREEQLFEFATQEGFDDYREEAYWDRNAWAYGHGSRTKLDGTPVKQGDRTNPTDARQMYDRDSKWAWKRVDDLELDLTQDQQVALADTIYNAGFTQFSKSKTYNHLKSGNLEGAAEELKSWGNPRRDMPRYELFTGKNKKESAPPPEDLIAMLGNPNITRITENVWRVRK